MIIETRHIRYFIAVAEELHFRRAAERLNLAQPALSRAIKQLERSVGTELLERSNRNVKLTPAGTVFLDGCRRSLGTLQRSAERAVQARDGKIGHLSIAYTDFAISGTLPRIIEQFRRECPGVTLDIVHMFTEAQIDALHRQAINIGFLTGPLESAGIDQIVVQQDQLVVVLPENHALARKGSVRLAEIANEPFIAGMPREWKHFDYHLNNVYRSAGITPRTIQEAFNSEGIFGLVAANMGISVLPASANNYYRKGMVVLPLADEHSSIPTEATWRSKTITPALEMFIDILEAFRVK